ncbi:MAG: PIG-L family deacetylase [Bryobacterales bacterium]|nr:PIG-L family deacetylase [Bryobacterales bacterium]
MKRRKFLTQSAATAAAGAALPAAAAQSATLPPAAAKAAPGVAPLPLPAKATAAAYANKRSGYSPFTVPDYYSYSDDLKIERPVPGKPHQGKVFAAVQAHSDDIPLYAGGLVAKLIDEGYTGYLIRISNDEAAGKTLGYGVVQNEIDNIEVGKALGCKKSFSFYYRNHRMDDCAEIEIRARLIFLFRVLQVDTLITMDPYNHYEENPDHLVAGRAAEAACWLSGAGKDYPEHYRAGLKPARVREKYYHARSPNGHNLVNRIVDIGPYIDTKVKGNVANKGKGPAGESGSRLRAELAKQGKRLPILGGNDESANHQYVKHFLMEDWRLLGQRFGLQYAEAFRYIGPEPGYTEQIRKYVDANAVTL